MDFDLEKIPYSYFLRSFAATLSLSRWTGLRGPPRAFKRQRQLITPSIPSHTRSSFYSTLSEVNEPGTFTTMSSASATSVPDTAYGSLSAAWNETIRSVRNLDREIPTRVESALSEVGKAFEDPTNLGTAVGREIDSKSVSQAFAGVVSWLSGAAGAAGAPADPNVAEVTRKVEKLASDFKAHTETLRARLDRSDLSLMGTSFNLIRQEVSHLPEGSLKSSLQTKMEPLRSAFQLSSEAEPVATAIVKLMKDDRLSMREIIQDLDSTSGSTRPEGHPPLQWEVLKMSIAALGDLTDKYSHMEDRELLTLRLMAPPSFLAKMSQFLGASI